MTKKFIVQPDFWALFPAGQINVLVAKNIDNSVVEADENYFKELLQQGAKEAKAFITEDPFSQNPVVAQWREAYTKFKTKKGARASIEALLKRVSQGRALSPINPLVDIYNSISLKYAIPCGGEDIDCISGDLALGKAMGGEAFLPLDADKDAPALPEEIIYYDNEGAVCRCLNWREAQRTMLTENTQNAFLVMESVNKEQGERASKAMAEMQQLVNTYFKTQSVTQTLTKGNTEIEIS